MATYKQPCIHCDTMIDRDARICINCLSRNPFGYHCPTCMKPIEKGQVACSNCTRVLYVNCPICGAQTFVGERCDACKVSLLVQCSNPRCEQMQFFQNEKCTACGKKLKDPVNKDKRR